MLASVERFARLLEEYPDVPENPEARSAFIESLGEEYGIDPREPAVTGIFKVLCAVRDGIEDEPRK